MLQLAVIPGSLKADTVSNFLSPLLKELQCLEHNGMTICLPDGDRIHLKVHLLIASGDIPAASCLANHEGHNSFHGCRICDIQTESLVSPNGRGRGRYYSGTILQSPPALRTTTDYVEGDPVCTHR